MIVESISKSDIEIRRDLFQNVILSGGTTMMKGFQERVQKQLPDISPQNVKVKVLGGSDRKFLPWVGGSILSSLGSFQQMWMSRQEYEEHGAIMIERKCP
jgi:actin-related protein